MSAHRPQRGAAAALVALAAVVVAASGCTATVAGSGTAVPPGASAGGKPASSLSATQLAQRAYDTLIKATSVHISGDTTEAGVRMQFEITSTTSGAEGVITTMGVDLHLKLIGSALYLQAPAAFWRAHAGLSSVQAAYLASKWIQTTATDDFATFQQFATPAQLAKQLFAGVDLTALTKADSRTIGGRPTVGLKDPSDDSLLYVATSGEPDPLAVVGGTSDDSRGQLLLSDYGKPVQITAPAPDETLTAPDTVAHI